MITAFFATLRALKSESGYNYCMCRNREGLYRAKKLIFTVCFATRRAPRSEKAYNYCAFRNMGVDGRRTDGRTADGRAAKGLRETPCETHLGCSGRSLGGPVERQSL